VVSSVRDGGYEALVLKEVATAIVQDIDQGVVLDEAFYHGFVVGAEISFGSRGCTPCTSSCACD